MSDKQVALETIQRMPEDATLDDITHRLEFLVAVKKGLDQIESGDVVPHEQIKKELITGKLVKRGGILVCAMPDGGKVDPKGIAQAMREERDAQTVRGIH